MTTDGKSNTKGALLALLAFALYAIHDVVVKTLGVSYDTFQIVFFSVLLSFPLVILMLMRDSTSGTLLPVHPWWSAFRTVSVIITGSSAFYAFSVLPLAQVYAILFASPLLITVLSIPILGERVGLNRWLAVGVGLAGVIVVLRPGATELSLGHLGALAAAVFGSLASIIVRKIGRDERSAVLLLYPMMANFMLMAALLPFVYEPMPVEHVGYVGIMALFAFIAGLCLIAAYKAGDAAIIAPMQYSQIIWAAILGSMFFQETPDTMTWVGTGIIISSGVYIVMREAFGGTSVRSPVLRSRIRYDSGTSPRAGMPTKQSLPDQ